MLLLCCRSRPRHGASSALALPRPRQTLPPARFLQPHPECPPPLYLFSYSLRFPHRSPQNRRSIDHSLHSHISAAGDGTHPFRSLLGGGGTSGGGDTHVRADQKAGTWILLCEMFQGAEVGDERTKQLGWRMDVLIPTRAAVRGRLTRVQWHYSAGVWFCTYGGARV